MRPTLAYGSRYPASVQRALARRVTAVKGEVCTVAPITLPADAYPFTAEMARALVDAKERPTEDRDRLGEQTPLDAMRHKEEL